MTFEETLKKKGSFSAKENEAIALAVSQANHCEYCLAAHSTIGKMVGYSDNEVMDIRSGTVSDRKLNALTSLASELTIKRGKTAQDLTYENYSKKDLKNLPYECSVPIRKEISVLVIGLW